MPARGRDRRARQARVSNPYTRNPSPPCFARSENPPRSRWIRGRPDWPVHRDRLASARATRSTIDPVAAGTRIAILSSLPSSARFPVSSVS
jgi:hypothetical protein